MRIVWTLNNASSTEVIKDLQAKKNWTESTIKTLLRRLVNKGWLKTTKDGRRFIYTATVSQTAIMYKASKELLDRMCDMHKGEVILQLLANSPISKGDLAKMQEIIGQKAKTAPDKVPCNCLKNGQKLC